MFLRVFIIIYISIRVAQCRYQLKGFISIRWRRQWHPTPVLLPGKSHGRRGLVGCSPCGGEELDTTERLHFHFTLSCIGEGNGNPLQCSCLENSRDGGAWWAAICGAVESDTTEVTQQQHKHKKLFKFLYLKIIADITFIAFCSFFLAPLTT